jgi:arylsulfatase A-like enzyme
MQSGLRLLAFVAVVATSSDATSGWALAQQVTGTLGSPSATTTVSNKQLPPPDPKFGGVIKNDALQSKPWWAPRVVPPKGAPNVLLIITDDAGFGVPSTFGGVIPTPTMDRIANEGLRYNRVFSTALCSPTRAALITGRNHHSVGFGVISEQSTGFPGYNSIIGKDKATIGRMLLDNGYATSWFGKNHNTPAFAASQVGPFDQWPTGMGFEYFYGFVGGDANQWQPNLFRNTTQIYPFQGKPGWNLITGMADDAIDYMTASTRSSPTSRSSSSTRRGRRTRRTTRPRSGWTRSAPCIFRRRLREAARDDLRQPEEARRDSQGRQADALAQ